jgi:malate dehydrogenase (quinone)
MIENRTASEPDVVLVGAGIMSATLGVFLKELEPALNISMVETLDGAALESSDAWNNAGTGHAANCELNYTPERSDGSIDISKALDVNVEFDLSRQFWSYLVTKGAIADPQSFIHPVPHMSFVHGPDNVAFLKKRFAAMSAHHCYYCMEYTEDKKKLSEWVPLVMEGRAADEQVAATRIITGADVDYGSLTRSLVRYLAGMTGFTAHYAHRVTHISREPGGRWRIDMKNQRGGETHSTTARFVYLGAGGGALLLLQKSGIPEGRGYGGFPVSGIWLRCDDAGINKRHHAKVYGKASVGSPPMSVPHLDTRGHWRQALAPVRALCGLFHQIPQVWLAHGPVRVDPAGQYRTAAGGCSRQFRSDQISDRTGSADGASPLRCPAGILSARQAGRLATRSGGTACADHQAGSPPRRISRVRHRTGCGS